MVGSLFAFEPVAHTDNTHITLGVHDRVRCSRHGDQEAKREEETGSPKSLLRVSFQ